MAKNAPSQKDGAQVRQVIDTSLDMVDVPLESSASHARGNLSMTVIDNFEPRPLSKPGLPFRIKE